VFYTDVDKRPEERVMFNGSLPQSFGHAVTGQLESNRTLEVFKLQPQCTPHRLLDNLN